MKKSIIFIAVTVMVFCIIVSPGCRDNKKNSRRLLYSDFHPVRRSMDAFLKYSAFKRIVKLETTENSLIGDINSVQVSPANGDIYVADYSMSKKVYRFNLRGSFLGSYGRPGQGPGEISFRIMAFTLSPDGKVIIASDSKLMIFNPDGTLDKEISAFFIPQDAVVHNNLLYLSVVGYRDKTARRGALVVYDLDLKFRETLLDYDARLDKYKLLPSRNLAVRGNQLFFISYYDLNITVLNPNGAIDTVLSVPNQNRRLETVWNKKELSLPENAIQEVQMKLHSFITIICAKDKLFLKESCQELKKYDYWVMDWPSRLHSIYEFSRTGKLALINICGSNEDALIGVMNDADTLEECSEAFAELKGVEYKEEENPLLLFFTPDSRVSSPATH